MFKKTNPAKTTLGTKPAGPQRGSSFRKASGSQRPPTPITVQTKGKPMPLDPMEIMAAPQRKR